MRRVISSRGIRLGVGACFIAALHLTCLGDVAAVVSTSNRLSTLFTDPAGADQTKQMRAAMLQWMEQTHDPLLPKFRVTTGVNAATAVDEKDSSGKLSHPPVPILVP